MTSAVFDITERDDVVLDGRQVCIVDDDDLFRGHVALVLSQKNLRTVEAGDTATLEDILDKRMPDCLLVDYNLVSENGLFVVGRLRQRYPSLAPIIMISADETQRTAVRAFRAGVNDFVAKRGMRIEDLVGAVRRAIARRNRDELRDQEMERLRRNASFDEQTGLLLRSALDERLPLVAETAERQRRSYGLVALQIARIGEVQDRFGIVATDKILRIFAQRLRDLIRLTDLCGIWTRGTFLCAVDSDVTPETLAAFVKRIVAQLTLKVDLASAHLDLSVVAASAIHPDDGETLEAIIACLEARLEAEKQAFAATAGRDWARVPEHDAATSSTERRREPRMRTLKQGRIVLNGLQSTIDCTIRNLSTGGAGLRLMGPTAIPEFFRLKLSDTGLIRKVRKCWHINNDLGVQFLEE